MLLVSKSENLPYIMNSFKDGELVILNLSSLKEGFQRVAIMPPSSLNFLDDINFDMGYLEYIFNNDMIFLEFMKIIIPLYIGMNVCVLVSMDDNMDRITESLLKIIQQRYGYNSFIINDPEDTLCIDTEIMTEEGFSVLGMSTLDQDRERYEYITTKIQLEINGEI